MPKPPSSREAVRAKIEDLLTHLTPLPGVYQMLNSQQDVLYVGKAKNLKKRVSSYFSRSAKSIKTSAMVDKIADIEVTITQSETEALLLEQTLIKKIRPPFNILLRDDKSYPYIFLSSKEPFPRFSYHRGPKKAEGRYFGPYPNSMAVRESLDLMQKLFKVRQCDDTFFRHRSRPCLQYQIKRCSAPCVGLVETPDYQQAVRLSALLLEGKNEDVLNELTTNMEQASESLLFEEAAEYRDQIRALRRVQETQCVDGQEGNVDAMGVAYSGGVAVVNVLFIRQGRVVGSKNFPIKKANEKLMDAAADRATESDIESDIESDHGTGSVADHVTDDVINNDSTLEGLLLNQFLPQFYIQNDRELPERIVLAYSVRDVKLLQACFSDKAGRKVSITSNVRGARQNWLKMAQLNASTYLQRYLQEHSSHEQRLEALQEAFGLEEIPGRMECFDISHTSGQNTVASCVVFDHNGPLKSHYRRFNIQGVTPGDDYAAMEQVLTRRYVKPANTQDECFLMPDLVIVDGGKGQLGSAYEILKELRQGHFTQFTLIGVAKGPSRRLGMEEIFRIDLESGAIESVSLDRYPSALQVIQHIRDESHRFAIAGHRAQRQKRSKHSGLESIPGVGPKRRQQLLKYFGGLQEVRRASSHDLAKVPGISKAMATLIYDHLHG